MRLLLRMYDGSGRGVERFGRINWTEDGDAGGVGLWGGGDSDDYLESRKAPLGLSRQ